MSGSSSLVQIQWSLDNTVFKAVELLQGLIRSAAEDDVHAQVVMAFEALGSALLVSPERISEGIDALSRVKQQNLSIGGRLKVAVGLNGLGVARIIRKRATQCVPAFLLVISCKICFDDAEIGNILHEMLSQFSLMRTFPASRLQMGQLASSISGYGDDIIPTKTLEAVTDAICRASRVSVTTPKIFWQADTKSIAEIFARTFGALLKDNIKRITLQGEVGGAFLASILLWLLPDEFGLSLEGVYILGQPDGRVILDLTSQEFDRWVIQEWQVQNTLQTVIMRSEDLFEYETSLVKFTGASSGLRVISAQFKLENDQVQIVGELATALVMTTCKYGVLSSDPETFSGSQQIVRLSEICQTGFLGNISCCMAVFGWRCDEEFTKRVQRLSDAMDDWIASGCPSVVEPTNHRQISSSPGLYMNWVFDNLEAWMKTSPDYASIYLGYSEDVLNPAIFLAAEALYACICDVLPSYRSLRGCSASAMHANAATLVALVFVPPTGVPKRVISNLAMMSVSEFRRLAITSLVPGCPVNVEKRDLVFHFNGYVAFASPLQKISTIPRECVAISIVPGVIRWGEDNATFDRIRESRTFISPNQISERRPVEVFNRERTEYVGLEPKADESGAEIESLISTSTKILQLKTYIRLPQGQNRTAVEVDWLSSINAVAVSVQVNEQDMLPSAEDLLAKLWLNKSVWDRMAWVQAHGTVTGGQFGSVPSQRAELCNYLSMTYGNEKLRFFLAGRCKGIKLYMRQGSTPLMQCVRVALEASQEERRELPTRQKSAAASPPALGEQSKTTKTLKPASGTIKPRNWIVIA